MSDLAMRDFSLVIPVYNEAESLPLLLSELRTALAEAKDYEVVFVDDGSRDQTVAVLKQERETFPPLRVVCHAQNAGQSTATVTGVRAARFPLIVTLDGDGQNDPADIHKLLARFRGARPEESLQLVCGHRVNRQDTWFRRLSSRIANGVRAGILGDGTPDTGCSLKVFPREAFLQLPHFDHLHRFLPALFVRNGGQVVSVAVNHRQRARGVSKYGLHNRLWTGIVDLLGVLWLMRRPVRPRTKEES